MFDRSLDIDPNYSGGHSGRASAYEQVADEILMAYGIFPVRFWTHSDNETEWEPVKYGNTLLGMRIKQLMPDFEFLTEIMWLYEQAEEEYKNLLETTFRKISYLTDKESVIYVRTDSRQFTLDTTSDVLGRIFPERKMRKQEQPITGVTQTRLFGNHTTKISEVDIVLNGF